MLEGRPDCSAVLNTSVIIGVISLPVSERRSASVGPHPVLFKQPDPESGALALCKNFHILRRSSHTDQVLVMLPAEALRISP